MVCRPAVRRPVPTRPWYVCPGFGFDRFFLKMEKIFRYSGSEKRRTSASSTSSAGGTKNPFPLPPSRLEGRRSLPHFRHLPTPFPRPMASSSSQLFWDLDLQTDLPPWRSVRRSRSALYSGLRSTRRFKLRKWSRFSKNEDSGGVFGFKDGRLEECFVHRLLRTNMRQNSSEPNIKKHPISNNTAFHQLSSASYNDLSNPKPEHTTSDSRRSGVRQGRAGLSYTEQNGTANNRFA